MSFFKTKKPTASLVSSLIGPGTVIGGDIRFEGGLRVEGTVLGSITGGENSIVVLVKGSKVTGSIDVPHVVVNSSIDGSTIKCVELELKSNAIIKGDISYTTLSIEAGAVISGMMTHNAPTMPAKAVLIAADQQRQNAVTK